MILSRKAGLWIVTVFFILIELLIALDGYHYWHDVRFAYAATEFPLRDVFVGAFNPHQAWTISNEVSTSGFYVSKMLHVALLAALFGSIDPSVGGFDVAVVLSVLMMLATIVGVYFFYTLLLRSKKLVLFAVACVLLAPVIPYLTGKLLSENTSLFFVVLSLVFTMLAANASGGKSIFYSIISGLLLTFAGLARLDSLFGPIGFYAALIILPMHDIRRKDLVRIILITLSVFATVYLSVLKMSGIDFSILYDYFVVFVNAGQKSVLMSLMGIVTFAGSIYLLAIAAVTSKRSRTVGFLSIWLLITALPALLITWNYMVEPRYLVQSLLPLCLLSAIGIENILSYFSGKGKNVISLIFVMVTLCINFMFVRLMPYELDRPALKAAIADINAIDPDASILIPWSYTDYNFLRLVMPEKHIYNVNSPVDVSIDGAVETYWQSRFHGWYGDKYIVDQTGIDKLLDTGPVYYLGWRAYPPVQTVMSFAYSINWPDLERALDGLNMMDHRKQSWVWEASQYNLQYVDQSGQYEYYRLEKW